MKVGIKRGVAGGFCLKEFPGLRLVARNVRALALTAVFGTAVLSMADGINDPIAYWSFESSEAPLDNVVSPGPYHDATVFKGAPSFGTVPGFDGLAGKSMVLDGNSAIELPYHQDNLGRNFTVSLWYWQLTNDTRQAIYQSRDYFNITCEAHWQTYTNNFFENFLGEVTAGGFRTELKEWTHLVHTVATSAGKSTLKVYTNGVLLASVTKTVDEPEVFDKRQIRSIYVGSYRVGGRYFKGMIDEVSLWNRVLTAADVMALYLKSKAGENLEVTPQAWPRVSFQAPQRSFTMEVDNGIPPGVYQYGWILSDKANQPAPAMSLPDTAARVDDTAGHPDGPFHADAFETRRLRIPLTSGGLGQLTQGDFTLETRFRLSIRNRGVLLGNFSTANRGVNLELINDNSSNRVRLYIQPLTAGRSTVDLVASADPVTAAIWDGQWYHLVGMRRGATCYLYLNGVKVGEKSDTAGAFAMTGDYYYIKGDTRTGYELFDGDIENARIWTRALDVAEVEALAAGAVPGGAEVSASNMLAEYASAYSPYNATYDNPMYRTRLVPPLQNITRTNFTAEAWFRTTNAARAVLIGNYSNSTAVSAFNLEIRETDIVRLYIQPGTGKSNTDVNSLALPYDIHDGQWRHMAGVVRDNTAYLYMNGVEVRSIPYVSGAFDLSPFGLCVGKDMRSSSDPNVPAFQGDIRDARVWSRALETNELAAIVAGSEPGSAAVAISNLLAEYNYNVPSNSLSKAGFPGSKFLRTYIKGTNSVTLVFENLPRHAEVGLGMLLAQLDSLNSDKDLVTIKLDGQEIFSASLSYNSGGETRVAGFKLFGQAADQQLLLNTSVSAGIDLFHCHSNIDAFNEHVYDLSLLEPLQRIPHTGGTLTLEISGIQDEDGGFEGLGIDRLELNVPAIKGTVISLM